MAPRALFLAACVCTTGQALVHGSSEQDKFWPFTSWSSEPAPTAHPKTVAFVHHEVPKPKPTEPPAARNMKDVEKEVVSTKKFSDKLALLCKDAGAESQKCRSVQGERLWCGLFARNVNQFMDVDGLKQLRTRCNPVNNLKGSEWFFGEGAWVLPSLRVDRSGSFMAFTQVDMERHVVSAPEDELAKEMTHDLEMNFNKIAPFGKEDTAKELQDHAAKTQDTLVDAVENAEVAEIKRAVFRALTRLRAATIKEFDTIARLETQAIDAYNDAHHYRAENPLAHLHEDEAPVETDKLKSFH